VTVQTFHGLCSQLARKAKLKLPQYEQGTAPPEYFERDLPDALIDAVAKLGPQFDALVVDEAQDLQEDWYEALLCVLDDERKANVWLFFDDNQRSTRRVHAASWLLEFELTVNCRNTQAIHREVMKLYSGRMVPDVKDQRAATLNCTTATTRQRRSLG